MSYFCHQVSITSEAWSKIIQHSEDPFQSIRTPIENLGGKFCIVFFTTGRFDVLAITEFPDSVTPADLSIAFAQGGAVASIQTTPLLTPAEAIEAHAHSATPFQASYPRRHAFAAVAGS